MHCCLMFVFHFFAGLRFCSGCFRKVLFIWKTKKVVAGCVRQVIVLYSNDCMRICLSGLSIDRLIELVIRTGLIIYIYMYIYIHVSVCVQKDDRSKKQLTSIIIEKPSMASGKTYSFFKR